MNKPVFDPHQFAGQEMRPVHAEITGEGQWETTGIDFSDYRRMSVQTHTFGGSGRRNETPEWALNDDRLRVVLIRYLERRAMVSVGTGDDQKRLERARAELVKLIGDKDAILTRLCQRYVKLKSEAVCEDRKERTRILRGWERDIEGLDTDIRMLRADCPGVILRLIYLYYRFGTDSVGVGEILHLKPPHVRQVLWRLNRVANYYWPAEILAKSQCEEIVLQHAAGNTVADIAADLRISQDVILRSFVAHGMPALARATRKRVPPISLPETRRPLRRTSRVDSTRALYLWNRGESLEQIAERFVGASPGHILNAIKFAVEQGDVILRPLSVEEYARA